MDSNFDDRKKQLMDLLASVSMPPDNHHDTEDKPPVEEPAMDLVTYLSQICDYISSSDFLPEEGEEIAEIFEILLQNIDYIRSTYEDEPPTRFLRKARQLMTDALDKLREGISQLNLFIQENDPQFIKEGMDTVTEADDILQSLKAVIAQERMELAEIMSKLQKGELKDGDKLDQDGNPIFLGDSDSLPSFPDDFAFKKLKHPLPLTPPSPKPKFDTNILSSPLPLKRDTNIIGTRSPVIAGSFPIKGMTPPVNPSKEKDFSRDTSEILNSSDTPPTDYSRSVQKFQTRFLPPPPPEEETADGNQSDCN